MDNPGPPLTDPSHTAHQKPANLASASLMELIGRMAQVQAAVIRNDSPEEIAVMRQQMHDVLDAYLDLSVEAAQLVRAIAHPR